MDSSEFSVAETIDVIRCLFSFVELISEAGLDLALVVIAKVRGYSLDKSESLLEPLRLQSPGSMELS